MKLYGIVPLPTKNTNYPDGFVEWLKKVSINVIESSMSIDDLPFSGAKKINEMIDHYELEKELLSQPEIVSKTVVEKSSLEDKIKMTQLVSPPKRANALYGFNEGWNC